MSETYIVSASSDHSIHNFDPSSVAWDFHQAAESFRQLDIENVPAVRRALRSLDRASQNLLEFHLHHSSHEHPVVFPDYIATDLQNLVTRPYVPDEQAQQLLANILRSLADFISVSPSNVEVLLLLLLTLSPCSELQLVWLQLLIHSSQDAWHFLIGSGSNDCSHGAITNASPWFERLFLLLQRALLDCSTSHWSVQGTKTKEYAIFVLWCSCISRVLTVVSHLYRSQAATIIMNDDSGVGPSKSDILSWMSLSLARHMQGSALDHSHPVNLQAAQNQCYKLLEMTNQFAHKMVEYAMDALDGALIAVERKDDTSSQHELEQWAIHDSMLHVDLAVHISRIAYEWNILTDYAAVMETMWKQCARAFVSVDQDGVVAQVVLNMASLYLKVAPRATGDDDGMALDVPTFALTLFRAYECCPLALAEATMVWDVLESEVCESENKELKSVVQSILMTFANELDGGAADDGDIKVVLGEKFLRLMNKALRSNGSEAEERDTHFRRRFTKGTKQIGRQY